MKRLSLLFFLSLSVIAICAQQFTEVLRTSNKKGGVVVLQQSAMIDSLVNGTKVIAPKQVVVKERPQVQVKDSVVVDSLHKPQAKGFADRLGYRIQIYTGTNSGESKSIAMSLRQRSLKLFPKMKAYCTFISPRWVVRIGDFASREQAMEQLAKVKASGISREVRLVKCKVRVPVY